MRRVVLLCFLAVCLVGCKALGPIASLTGSAIGQYMATQRQSEVNAKLDAILLDRGIDTAAIAEAREKGASIQQALDKMGMIAQATGLVEKNPMATNTAVTTIINWLAIAGYLGFKKYKSNKLA